MHNPCDSVLTAHPGLLILCGRWVAGSQFGGRNVDNERMATMRTSSAKVLLCVACVAACGAIVLADSIGSPPGPGLIGTAGWRYGRTNCAPWSTPAVATKLGCLACCTAAGNEEVIAPEEVDNCKQFCNTCLNCGW